MSTSDYTTWKDIPGFEGLYQACDNGYIRRIAKKIGVRDGSVLRGGDVHGYNHVILMKDGKRHYHLTHRLIMLTFKPRDDAHLFQVNHIDGDRLNNHSDNLEYVTCAENIRHSRNVLKTKRNDPIGAAIKGSKLTDEKVMEIRALYAVGNISQDTLAIMFGVCQDRVSKIIQRKAWKHI